MDASLLFDEDEWQAAYILNKKKLPEKAPTLNEVVLLAHPVAGGSWEGWIIENLLACAPPTTQCSYYRTAADAEIDLLLELPGAALWAVEIKRSSAPTISRGYHTACDDVAATRRLVVSSATQRFPMAGGLEYVPLLDLMHELLALRRAQLVLGSLGSEPKRSCRATIIWLKATAMSAMSLLPSRVARTILTDSTMRGVR